MRFTFRRLTRADFPVLARWLAAPHVVEWWNHESSPEALESDFGDTVDGVEPAEDFIALVDDEPVGVVQYCHFVDYPEYVAEMEPVYPVGEGAATIDYLVGDLDRVGRGLGSRMIADFVEFVWQHDAWATHLVVPVNSANERSWRALLRAGFRLEARGDLVPDNPAHDALHEILRIDRPA